MKKIVCFLLTLVLAAGMTACSNGTEPTEPSVPATAATEPTTAPTAAPTEAPTSVPKLLLEDLISESRTEHIDYTDDSGNPYKLDCAIPKINLDSDAVKQLNEQITDLLTPYLDDAVKAQETKTTCGLSNQSYDAWLDDNGHVTLLLTIEGIWDNVLRYAYTVDTSTGSVLSRNGIAMLLKMRGSELTDAIRSSTEAYMAKQYAAIQENDPELYDELLQQTLTDEILDTAQCYIDADGNAQIICRIASPAGAAYYVHTYPLVRESE